MTDTNIQNTDPHNLLTEDARESADQLRPLSAKLHWICVDKGLIESNDVSVLLDEADKTQDILNKIALIEDLIDQNDDQSPAVKFTKKIKNYKETPIPSCAEIQKRPVQKFKKQSNGVIEVPDVVFVASDEYETSFVWLKKNSLKAKRINLERFTKRACLYHKPKKIESTRSVVTSRWYQDLFPISDQPEYTSTTKHIDLPIKQLQKLKNQLQKSVKRYQQRILWYLEDNIRSHVSAYPGSIKGDLIIAVECCQNVDKNFRALLSRMVFQQVFKNRVSGAKSFNICLFSSLENPQFWHRPDFGMTLADDSKIRDIELWLDCIEGGMNGSGGDALIGLEAILKNKAEGQKLVVITNRTKASAECFYSLENLEKNSKNCEKSEMIISTVFTDPEVSQTVIDAYSENSKSVFKAFSETEKTVLVNRTKTIAEMFSKASFDELFSWARVCEDTGVKNEYFLPRLDFCPEVDRLNVEFNRAVRSLLELSETFKRSEGFYARQ